MVENYNIISIEQRFKNYKFEIIWNSERSIDEVNDAIDVRVYTNDNKEYSANFVAKRFLDKMFEKNKRTGECADGSYFAMPGMIVVERLNEIVIRNTLDDMIKNSDILEYVLPLE